MVNTLGDVKGEIRSLIGDPDGDFATDAYLTPLINIAQKKAVNFLEGTCSPFIEQVIDVPNVAQGTTSLVTYQTAGKQLAGLVKPFIIEFKQSGQPINTFCEAEKVLRLPNIAPNANPTTRGTFFEFRSYVIYLTPLTYIADFRVRGDFRPAPLMNDDDVIVLHPMFAVALSFGTAALIGVERGNQNYVTNYGGEAETALDDIAADLIRSTQATTTRVGRMTRGRSGLFTRVN